MQTSFEPSASMGAQARLIAQAQIAEAIEGMRAAHAGGDLGVAVHTIRKQSKRQRALIRSLGPALSGKESRRRRSDWRDIGRRFSPARDADVLAAALATLVASSPEIVEDQALPVLREFEVRRDAAFRALRADGVIPVVLRSLGEQSRAVDRWMLGALDWDVLLGQIAVTYRRGTEAFETAAASGDPRRFHEARKRAKDLWYQADLLREAWRPGTDGTRTGAKELSGHLGRLQDLVVMRDAIDAGRGTAWDEDVADTLLVKIGAETERHMSEAVRFGHRLYAEKPGAFRRRWAAYSPAD